VAGLQALGSHITTFFNPKLNFKSRKTGVLLLIYDLIVSLENPFVGIQPDALYLPLGVCLRRDRCCLRGSEREMFRLSTRRVFSQKKV